jgi:hypothetical protein
VGTWEADDPAYARPIAAPLERCAELLGVDLVTITGAATHIEPYVRVDGTKVWSLMQLERQLRPQAYGGSGAATLPTAGSEAPTAERHDRQMPSFASSGIDAPTLAAEDCRP